MVSSVSVCWISEPFDLQQRSLGPGARFGLCSQHSQQRDFERTQIDFCLCQAVTEAYVFGINGRLFDFACLVNILQTA